MYSIYSSSYLLPFLLQAVLSWTSDPSLSPNPHSTAGTARDISLLIEFLPIYLFPSSSQPHTITTWAITGFSLGGHATWAALRSEPRLSIGAVYAGCPDFLGMMEARMAEQKVGELQDGLRKLVEKDGPMACEFQSETAKNPYLGKKIMIVAGSKDTRAYISAHR
jgi:hypothetical protein